MNTSHDFQCSICRHPLSVPIKIAECGHVLDLHCLINNFLLNHNDNPKCPLDGTKINIAKLSYDRTKNKARQYTEILINNIFQAYGFVIPVPVDTQFFHLDGLITCKTNVSLLDGEEQNFDYLDHHIRNVFHQIIFDRSNNSRLSLKNIRVVTHHSSFCGSQNQTLLDGAEIVNKTVGDLGFAKDEKHALYWSKNY